MWIISVTSRYLTKLCDYIYTDMITNLPIMILQNCVTGVIDDCEHKVSFQLACCSVPCPYDKWYIAKFGFTKTSIALRSESFS